MNKEDKTEQVVLKIAPQFFYDRVKRLKDEVKGIHEEIAELEQDFIANYSLDLEYPIEVEGKQKFIRLYEPEGKFVYNTKYEIGVRATAKNLASEVQLI